jgi:hypothetical protein
MKVVTIERAEVSADAGAFAEIMRAAINRGAVAVMVLFELPDGSTDRLFHPPMSCVARGLTEAASIIEEADEV